MVQGFWALRACWEKHEKQCETESALVFLSLKNFFQTASCRLRAFRADIPHGPHGSCASSILGGRQSEAVAWNRFACCQVLSKRPQPLPWGRISGYSCFAAVMLMENFQTRKRSVCVCVCDPTGLRRPHDRSCACQASFVVITDCGLVAWFPLAERSGSGGLKGEVRDDVLLFFRVSAQALAFCSGQHAQTFVRKVLLSLGNLIYILLLGRS